MSPAACAAGPASSASCSSSSCSSCSSRAAVRSACAAVRPGAGAPPPAAAPAAAAEAPRDSDSCHAAACVGQRGAAVGRLPVQGQGGAAGQAGRGWRAAGGGASCSHLVPAAAATVGVLARLLPLRGCGPGLQQAAPQLLERLGVDPATWGDGGALGAGSDGQSVHSAAARALRSRAPKRVAARPHAPRPPIIPQAALHGPHEELVLRVCEQRSVARQRPRAPDHAPRPPAARRPPRSAARSGPRTRAGRLPGRGHVTRRSR
jgi:hypothetical protein